MRSIRLNFILIFCVLMVAFSCETESTVGPAFKDYYIKYYGGDGQQEAKDFVVNADGTVVMVGTWTETTGNKRVYIVKTDVEGNIIWDKKLGSTNNELAADIELITQGPDAGNLVVLSNYTKNTIDSMAIRLTIFSQAGDSLKGALYNFYGSQLARSITSLTDGGYYIAAKTSDPANTGNPNNPTKDNVLYIRLRNDFTTDATATTRIPGFYIASTVRIYQISATQFYFAGYSDFEDGVSNPGETSNLFFQALTVLGSGGSTKVTMLSGSNDDDEVMGDIAESPSGQFMAVGTAFSGSSQSMIATRISSSFGTASSIRYIIPNNAEGVAVAPSGASDFLLLGNAYGSGNNRDIYIQKVDFNFEELITLQFGSTNNDDTGSAIAELPNGDILILGTMELVNQKKMALIKVRPNGKF